MKIRNTLVAPLPPSIATDFGAAAFSQAGSNSIAAEAGLGDENLPQLPTSDWWLFPAALAALAFMAFLFGAALF